MAKKLKPTIRKRSHQRTDIALDMELKRAIKKHNIIELEIQALELKKQEQLNVVQQSQQKLELYLASRPDVKYTKNGLKFKSHTDKILQFHKDFHLAIGNAKVVPSADVLRQRIKLQFEELFEYVEAVDKPKTFLQLCAQVIVEFANKGETPLTESEQEFLYGMFEDINDGDNVDLVEAADALGDQAVLIAGTNVAHGFVNGLSENVFDAICTNNNAKGHTSHEHALETARQKNYKDDEFTIQQTTINGKEAHLLKNSIGKLVKPHDHIKVDLHTVLYGEPKP